MKRFSSMKAKHACSIPSVNGVRLEKEIPSNVDSTSSNFSFSFLPPAIVKPYSRLVPYAEYPFCSFIDPLLLHESFEGKYTRHDDEKPPSCFPPHKRGYPSPDIPTDAAAMPDVAGISVRSVKHSGTGLFTGSKETNSTVEKSPLSPCPPITMSISSGPSPATNNEQIAPLRLNTCNTFM